jgi:pimeloyl-ACP methyl ester carboxylesterase
MKSIQVFGHGVPLVLVPGVQGRWEYMRPTLDALARSFRVITFPLCGEPTSGRRFDPVKGLDNFVDQLDHVLDECDVESAVICGISFGGLIALHYSACRPARASALVLASAPGPSFQLRKRHQIYARIPMIFGPLFLAEMPRRVGRELAVAMPRRRDRMRFGWAQVRTFLRAPVSASRMAERSRMLGGQILRDDCARVSAPTLVLTGEPELDYVVPVGGTSDYAKLIPGARAARIDGTGHLGYVTRPEVFAALVADFVAAASLRESRRSRSRDGGSPHAA